MRQLARTTLLVVGAWCLPAAWARADEPPEPAPSAALATAFSSEVRPLLARYCFECHGGKEPQAKLALDRYLDAGQVLENRAIWELVGERLRDGEMPPEGEPQPAADEARRIDDWLERQFAAAGPTAERDPGRVTIRRLNRAEYNNTIRDLLGVDFQPAADFPADDVGYGFDNIGDVLSLPPILLEKYLSAAHAIAQRAIVAHPAPPQIASVDGAAVEGHTNGEAYGTGWLLTANGDVHITVRVPQDGEYRLRVVAFGQQAGPDPARLALRIDGRRLGAIDVPAEESEPQTCEVWNPLEAGEHRIAVVFLNDYYRPEEPDRSKRDRNLVVQRIDVEGPREIGFSALPESHRRIIPREPGEKDQSALAGELLRRFASRAYRRPATDAELARLVKLFELGAQHEGNFAEGIQLAVEAVLVSPYFLFRIELDPASPPAAAGLRRLTDFEIATRLSYFLWSSMPDDELSAAAAAGTLHEPVQLAAQVRRMLADPKAAALGQNFAGQWLQLRSLKNVAPDRRLFPEFDEPLREAMREETELFFAAVVREDLSVLDFLDADFTFLNERLAQHYGIAGVQGSEFRRVQLSGDQRGGLLTQASILTVTSNPTRTSPVKRGKWVLENLLAAPPPPPPPGVGDLKAAPAGAGEASLRKRLERHRTNPDCGICHNRMDPIGFGLENYSAIGAWRTHDGRLAIDASGTLPGGRPFAGPGELKRALKSKQTQFVRCLAQKLLTYAIGRGLEDYDRGTVSDIVAAAAEGGNRFSSIVTAVVQSDAFLKCRTGGEHP